MPVQISQPAPDLVSPATGLCRRGAGPKSPRKGDSLPTARCAIGYRVGCRLLVHDRDRGDRDHDHGRSTRQEQVLPR